MARMDKLVEFGRLALRVEGNFWVAYFAAHNTMDGAIQLGSLHMTIATLPAHKAAFMALMQAALADITRDATGGEMTWPDPPQSAPEHERAGSA